MGFNSAFKGLTKGSFSSQHLHLCARSLLPSVYFCITLSTTAVYLATNVEKSAIQHKYFLGIYQITWHHIQKRHNHRPENVKPGLPERLRQECSNHGQ
jgi:hypothetical protein